MSPAGSILKPRKHPNSQSADDCAVPRLCAVSFMSEFKSGWTNTETDFSDSINLPFTFSRYWEEAFGGVGNDFEGLLPVVLCKTAVDSENFVHSLNINGLI